MFILCNAWEMKHRHRNMPDTNLKLNFSIYLVIRHYAPDPSLRWENCAFGVISGHKCAVNSLIFIIINWHLFSKLPQLTFTFITLAESSFWNWMMFHYYHLSKYFLYGAGEEAGKLGVWLWIMKKFFWTV